MIAISLFDNFTIRSNGTRVALPYRQTEATLAYLVVSHPEPVEKDLLAEIIWPKRPPGVARKNLRHALHVLRTMAGMEEFIFSSRNTLALEFREGFSCDYLSFLALTEPSDCGLPASSVTVHAVLGMYGTGLLENFTVEPSREYGFWLYTARRSCANRLYRFLASAIPGLCGGSDDLLLSELACFLLLRDPYDTSLYEFLLRSLIARGRAAFADGLHRDASDLVGRSGDPEALNGLAEVARRLFPEDSYPVKRRLPSRLLPFVGRERERDEIAVLLGRQEVRLVTITAPGGYGKTSLSLAVGRNIDASLFPDGVFFSAFRDQGGRDDAVSVLLSTFEITSERGREEALVRYLQRKKLLIIMDELEDAASAPFLARLLIEGCPDLKILATSRRDLGLNIEWIYRLLPFGREKDAEELFSLTAERKTGKRKWTEKERELAGRICDSVDFVPLAVELAASGLGAADEQSLESVLTRLTQRPGGGLGDMDEIIEYQIGLLSEPSRRSFFFLSLFRDRFERESACRAFGFSGQAFDEYCRLSLVWPADNGVFRLHSRVRFLCLSRLEERGEAGPAVARLDEFLAEECERHFPYTFSLREDPIAVAELYTAELENALLRAYRRRDCNAAMKFAIPLGSYLHYNGLARKERELFLDPIDSLLSTAPVPLEESHGILQILLVGTVIALQLDEYERGQGILGTMRRINVLSGRMFFSETENAVGQVSETETRDLYRDYLSISFPWVEGIYALHGGDKERARELFRESRRRAVLRSAHLCRVYVEIHLAMTGFEKDPDYAIGLLDGALRSSHGQRIWGIRSEILLLLARFHLAAERPDEAASFAEEVLANSRKQPDSRTEMEALFILSLTHLAAGYDREIPRTYLLRALETAGKNGLFGTAADSAITFVRRWKEALGAVPDWEIYDSIAYLSRGTEHSGRKAELDRLFNLA